MRTAIIGFGRMGRRHVRAVRELGWEVAGACDASAAAFAAAEAEERIESGRCYHDAAAMLAATRPECVIVATTAPSHCDYTCRAAEAGARLVLCEKPMAVSLDECDRMIRTCAARGTRLAINHPMRYFALYRETRRLVASPEFGGLRSLTVVAGNMGLAMNGLHCFELFQFLTGESDFEVTGWLSEADVPNPRGPQYHDKGGSVRLVTPGGRRMFLEAGTDQGHGVTMVCAGAFGQLVLDELTGTLRVAWRKEEHRGLPTTRYGCPEDELKLAPEKSDICAGARDALRALADDGDYPTAEHGRAAVRALVAAHVSHESHHAPVSTRGMLPTNRQFAWA